MSEARYDGFADWYDAFVMSERSRFRTAAAELLRRLLGSGEGRCLDLGCGGGVFIPVLADLGWSVTGVDVSRDQLRVAHARVGERAELVRADATALPFADGLFAAVVAAFLHTDVDDVRPVFAEAARVLRPDGVFVYLGTHPCFVGHFAELLPEGRRLLHSGYRDARWHTDGPGISPRGLRSRVGARHVPLAELLGAATAAGLSLARFDEDGPREVPELLAFAATRIAEAA